MANISNTNSTYGSGGIDTQTTLDGTFDATFQQMNGVASGVIAVETVLGDGPTLKGNLADLVTRLAVNLDADGHIDLTDDAVLDGNLSVAKGGTGLATLTANKLLVGAGTSDVTFASGLAYQGPTSIGAGSTAVHEGSVTINANQALDGIHFYTDFTLNTGKTVTLDSLSHRLIIVASGTVTLNGSIVATGKGSLGGTGGSTAGTTFSGTRGQNGIQPGGGGGNTAGGGSQPGGVGGDAGFHGVIFLAGGAGTGGTPSSLSGDAMAFDLYSVIGGAGGSGGGGRGAGEIGGNGGNGGGSIVIIAPTIILGAASTINTAGAAGTNASGAHGGGGGGGASGNVYAACMSYTDSGCTFTQTGGAGGSPTGAGVAGGVGAAGVKQILIYT